MLACACAALRNDTMKRKNRPVGSQIRMLVEEMLHCMGHHSSSVDAAPVYQLQMTRLEERVLMSASPAAVVADVISADAAEGLTALQSALSDDPVAVLSPAGVESESLQAAAQVSADNVASGDFLGLRLNSGDATRGSASGTVEVGPELIVIDYRVQDADTLLSSLLNSDRDVRLLRLTAGTDGVQQITEKLEQLGNVSAIHLLTHGSGGEILLGSTVLNASTLAQHAPDFLAWQHNLTANADLLIYGCDVAGTPEGKDFVASLANLTAADVAASADTTGHTSFGGNWDLEFTTGQIEASTLFTADVQQDWLGKLAVINVTTFADNVDGNVTSVANLLANKGIDGAISLREAILAINAGTGGDTINLAAGTYTLSIAGIDENAAASGDLDILKTMTILGTGSSNTIINANGIDRVFHVLGSGGQLTLSNLTVTGGYAGTGSGGGLLVATSANQLTLNSVVVSGNSATNGAGIDNAGTLSLTDVTISNNGNQISTTQGGGLRNTANATLNRVTLSGNSADLGGGIYNDFGTGNYLTLTNVTVSGNTAASAGGGLYTLDPVTIASSTFTLNTSDTGGGIRTQTAGATVSLKNTIVAGNIGTSANPDLSGSFLSSGNNLIGNGTGQSNLVNGVNGDRVGTSGSPLNPLLAALQNYGGQTPTHALLAGSLAINAGTTTGAPATDQRGYARAGAVDIGAYEALAAVYNKIYWADFSGNRIQRSNLDGSSIETLVSGISGPGGLAVDLVNGKIYWSEYFTQKIRRANLDGTGIQDIATGIEGASGIALDVAGGKIYFIENGLFTNRILRANLNGTSQQALVTTGLSSPTSIQLDVAAGKMYWTDSGTNKIQKANLDGTSVSNVYSTSTAPKGLALDIPAGKMYWVEDDLLGTDYVRSGNMNGSGGITNLVSTGLQNPIGVIVNAAEGKVYWSDYGTDKIQRANLNGTAVEDVLTGIDFPANLAFGIGAVTNSPPVITSNGGGASATLNVVENTTAVTIVTATDADLPVQSLTYSISGGADSAKFTIGSSSGVLSFITAPDFESPSDVGGNNVYDVNVQVNDGTLSDTQAIAVTVTNQAITSVSATGNATVNSGMLYTLNLSANENATSWTINWGDGVIDTIGGNPSSATHTYTNQGFTNNILVSAADAAGTHFQNELLVASFGSGDSLFRFAANTGAFLQKFATSNGLNDPIAVVVGPDGNLYVGGEVSKNILRYNATTGAFVDTFVTAGASGLKNADGLAFGPDGNLYVADYGNSRIMRFDGTTGAFLSNFVTAASGGLNQPYSITFGPDGNLYVNSYNNNSVLRYNGTTGAFINTFVTSGSGGLNTPEQMVFGPDGNLYISSFATNQILRYNGTTGAAMGVFVASGSGGLSKPSGIAFGPDGNLYVSNNQNGSVLRYDGTTGAFIGQYVTPGSGGLVSPTFVTFLPSQQVKVLPNTNSSPIISSNGAGASAAINVAENTTAVTIVTATDSDLPAQSLVYSIVPGLDAAKFAINSSTGVLSFVTAPDFEVPTDIGLNNVYDLTVQVSDGAGGIDTQAISVTVTNTNDTAPVVTPGQTFVVPELAANGTSLGSVTATDADGSTTFSGWAITAGNTGGVFAINATTGVITVADRTNLNFDITPSYALSVTVSDGVNTSALQTITVNVTDSPNTAPIANVDSYTVLEGGTLNQTVVPGWFNSNWEYRQKLVFNNAASSTNLINNAVLVKLHASAVDAIHIDYSATQNAGQDLRFVDPDGTVLAYEIEKWDESGYSCVWVKVPQIDAGSVTDSISMYYGNSTAVAGQNPAGVWRTNDVGIFHMNANGTDSTTYANNGLQTNVVAASGQIAGSGSFDGLNSTINAQSAASVDNIFVGGGAISAWINPVSWGEGGYGRIADKGTSTTGALGWGFQVAGTTASDGYLVFESDFTGTVGRWRTAAGTISENVWQNVAVVYDNTSALNVPRIYVNGTQLSLTVMSTPVGTARSDAAQDLTIGNRSGATDRTFSGRIDEVRFSSASLTADQIKAVYKTAAGNFITAGSVESGPGGLLNNDFDVNGDLLTVSLVSGPARAASFTLNPDGSFTYVHDGSETATDSFIYRISDGSLTSTATVYLTITPVNDNSPIITSNGGGATASINVAENTTAVTTVTATDADLPAATLTYSISGGLDAAKFAINSSSGVLRFITAPDYEAPTDNGSNNVYNVTVRVSDGTFTDTQAIAVAVTPVNDNTPIITSNGGGATAAINVFENTTAVTTVVATDADLPAQAITYAITGGSDALRFAIDSTTGVLSFLIAPDFELPADFNLDNVYEVQVTANDNAGRTTVQSISVRVLDISGPLIVDTTLDELDGNVTSVEALIANKGYDGKISLREAIIAANNTPGAQIIQLSAGNYVLTRTGSNEEAGLTGDLDITGSLTIRGAGAGITTIDGNGIDRVLDIKAGSTVNIEDVTIRGGSIGNKWGGGINVATGSNVTLTRVVVTANSGDSGGGVYSYKSVIVMTDTTIDGNSGKWGGGFYNDGGTASLNRVTVSNNTASTDGGGIYNVTTGGSLNTVNVTVSGNTTPGAGGGLYTKRPATITNSTIAYNSGSTGGGIHIANPGTATLKNTIVAFNTGGNANQAVTSLGNNIDSGTTLGLSQSGDRSNTDPRLATLQNNGGLTKTHALLIGSAAINTGAISGAPALDQRGISRDATPDIGAFELVGANGSPFMTSAANSTVAENQLVVLALTATDPDSDPVSISISGGADAARFLINPSNQLVFIVAPDFELPADANGDNIYEVRITVSDGNGGTGEQDLLVTVTDVNEFAVSAITDSNGTVNAVSENAANGTVVGITAFATDADATNSTVTYSLDSNSDGRFAINSTTGVVTVANGLLLDRESAASHNIIVRATSADLSSTTKQFTISVLDVNEFPVSAITDANGAVNAVNENAANGTVVGITAFASDADATTNTITYSLAANAGGRFAINSTTGVVTVANGLLLDRESAASHNIIVRATSADLSSTTKQFTISVLDVNEFPVSAITDSNGAVNAVNENAANGTVVGVTAFASDADATTNTVTYSLAANAGGRFAINSTTGVVTVANGLLLDRESAASHNITVRATSADLSSTTKQFTISVLDVNEFPVSAITDANGAVNAVNENAANGTLVGVTAFATDADATNSTVTYSLDSNSDGRFAINSTTGVVTVTNGLLLDHESAASHNITVRATSSDSSFATKQFSIIVLDVNEAPSILITQTVSSLPENANTTPAINIAIISLIDDALGSNTLSLTGADAAKFEIMSGNLRLRAGMALDAETQTLYTVTVVLRDTTLSSTPFSVQIVNLTITNVDEPPTADAGGPYAISEGDTLTVVAGPSVDPEGMPLSYAWDIDGDGLFDDATGSTAALNWNQLTALAIPVNDNGTRTIAVRVTDPAGNATIATSTLTISNTAPIVNVSGNATATSGVPYTISLAASDPGADTITTYRITWGDGITENVAGTATSASHVYLTPGGTRSITAQAIDEDGTFAMSGGPLVVTVLNTAPSSPTLSNNVVAGLTKGAAVGTLSFTDPDFGDSHTWTVSDNRFRVTGSQLTLKNGQQLNPVSEPTVTLTVTVRDASGATGVSIFNLRVNNAPVAVGDTYDVDGTQQLTVSSPSIGVLANDSDVDGDSFSASLVSGPGHAAAFGMNPNGTFWYRAASGYSGVDSFRYQLNDGTNLSAVTTVVLNVNQPGLLTYSPLLSSVLEHQTLTTPLQVGSFNIADDGFGANTITLSGRDAALFSLDGSNNLFLKAGLTVDFSVSTQFELTGLLDDPAIAGTPDASLGVIVAVQNVNDAPVGSFLADVTILEDAPPGTIRTAAAFSDIDGDVLKYSLQIVSQTPGLIRTFNINQTTGVISYSLNANAFGSAGVRVTAKDPANATASLNFNLIVQPVADAPIAQAYSNSTYTNQVLKVSGSGVLSSVNDPDHDSLTVALVSGPANGTLTLQADGAFVYTPNAGFQGVDTFRFVASDGTLSSNIATATISVLPQFIGGSPASSSGTGGFGNTSSGTSAGTTTQSSSAHGAAGTGAAAGNTAILTNSASGSTSSSNGPGQPQSADLTLASPGLLPSTNQHNDDEFAGMLPTVEPGAAERITTVTTENLEPGAREFDSDHDRRSNANLRRGDFDTAFSQLYSTNTMYSVSTASEQHYRNLADYAGEQADSVFDDMEKMRTSKNRIVGSVGVVTTGFSVGYLFWAIRGGMLVSGLLAQMPAWAMLDPLLVIDDDQKEEDKESLQNIVDRQQAKLNQVTAAAETGPCETSQEIHDVSVT